MPPKKRIYPIFLPHAGCPFQCAYCNQHTVAYVSEAKIDPVAEVECKLALYANTVRSGGQVGEIAFYGGTFTALPLRILVTILSMAAKFVEDGVFSGVRFSTRPDCMSEAVCAILAKYPVRTIELGIQSLSDPVLMASRRGYTAQMAIEAAVRVRDHGWALGVQLMAGLPEDTSVRFIDSVKRAIEISPDFLRIYPALVLKGTLLAEWFAKGLYHPLNLEQALSWVVPAYDILLTAGIPVIRMGLHSDPALEAPGAILGGPYHPAFGYLVRCHWWRNRVDRQLARFRYSTDRELSIRVPPNLVSDLIGPARSNIDYWKNKWDIRDLKIIGWADLKGVEFSIESAALHY